MSRHALAEDAEWEPLAVVYRDDLGDRHLLEVASEGRRIVLTLHNGFRLRISLANFDRLKNLLTLAGNEAAYAEPD